MNHLKNWFVSLVLGGYIVLLSYLLITGTISKYINPRLSFLLIIALLMLVGMLFFSFKKWGHKKSEGHHHCDCIHPDTDKLEKGNIILLLPIILAFMTTPQILSYQPMNTEGTGRQPLKTQSSQASETPPVSSPETDTVYKEYTQSAIGYIIFMNDESAKQELVNAKITLQGMVLHWHKLKANEVVVYRIMINCCAADGLPLGILVKLPCNMNFNDGDWIRAEGTIQLRPFTDEIKNIEPIAVTVPLSSQYPYFTATNVYRISTPAEPYLFP